MHAGANAVLLFRSRSIKGDVGDHGNPSLGIPTESRTTLSEAEGDVRLSGGISALCPAPCRIREFNQGKSHGPLPFI